MGDVVMTTPVLTSLQNKYPKAPDFDYKKSVYLFTKSGASNGAAAVYNYYNLIGKKFLFWLYQKSKLFEKSSEFFYEFIARNRNKFRVIGHFFYGSDFLPDKYRISAWIYGRALGLVGFVAFLSFWMQADILIGSNGIIPFADDLKEVENISLLWQILYITGIILHLYYSIYYNISL